MNIRSQAISWWNSLTENSKIKFATGREIQIIFVKSEVNK